MAERQLPPAQILEGLRRAKRAGLPFPLAWHLAVHGHVCDSYASKRSDARAAARRRAPKVAPGEPPPGLRPSDGEARCAGCRFHQDGRCGLYGQDIFAGVDWPTEASAEWRQAMHSTRAEWEAAYEGKPTGFSRLAPALAAAVAGGDRVERGDAQRARLAA